MRVHHILTIVFLVSVLFFSALAAISPGYMTRTTGPQFLCESTMPTATCENRYGQRMGAYETLQADYRGDTIHIGVK